MRIAILSKADRFGGGASRVAEDLCRLLQAHGHIAHHYLGISQTKIKPYQHHLYGNKVLGKFIRKFNHYVKYLGFPELIPWELFFLSLQGIAGYDILHFHDLSSVISPLTVRRLSRKMPTLWTFHDCSPFTGGCLYPMDCENFRTRCGQCPQLGAWPIDAKFDFMGFMQDIKRTTAQENNFVAVTPSTWMAEMAMSSGMFVTSPLVVPYGIDTNLFKPIEKSTIRKKLGFPKDRYVILISAAYIYEERKGIRYALKALNNILSLQPYLLIVGRIDTDLRVALREFDSLETGYLDDEQKKAEYFASADLFLFCSLADNLPLTILETMATATPTVGFATGGASEMIEHNKSGYLVPQKDIDGLVKGIHLALLDKRAAFWGQNARKRAETHYSYDFFLQNHLNLYETTIKNFKK